jgi:hypothetical protein
MRDERAECAGAPTVALGVIGCWVEIFGIGNTLVLGYRFKRDHT